MNLVTPPEDLPRCRGWRTAGDQKQFLNDWDSSLVPSRGILKPKKLDLQGSDQSAKPKRGVRFELSPEAEQREERPYRENYGKREETRRKRKQTVAPDLDTSKDFGEDFTLENLRELLYLLRMSSKIVYYGFKANEVVRKKIYHFMPKYQNFYKKAKASHGGPKSLTDSWDPMRQRNVIKITP